MLPIHPREIERLAALHDLDVWGTAPEAEFNAICETTRDLFGAPIALVSLVAETQQWFKARCGIDLEGTERGASFCTYALMSDSVFVVEDATKDPRFSENVLVKGEGGIRFYAGAPLIVGPGLQIGSLCILDRVPRLFTPEQCKQLQRLAQVVTAQLRQHKTERLLRESEAKYRLLADNTTDMIVRGDLDGTRRYISPACKALLGYEPRDLVGTKPLDFVHGDDLDTYGSLLSQIQAGELVTATAQPRYRRRDGTWVWVEANFNLTYDAETGRPDGYVASVRDITLRKEAEARLAHLARHDPLTGLPNRLQFRESLQAELARARRTGIGFALHCLDLDRFKQVNDTLGHKAGDRLLHLVAERLLATIRAEDTVARLGGDEFVIIQTGSDQTGAEILATRLIDAVLPPFDLGGSSAQIGVSIGIAFSDGQSLDGEELYKRADKALYAAKTAGRSTYRLAERTR